jgi:hypothetical protein
MKATWSAVVIGACALGWALSPRLVLSHGSITTTVLFDREIVRILNNHCVACHMDGGLAFPLSTYEETWVRGRSIRTAILRHHMPPWPAVSGFGEFVNDNSLTLRETQFFVAWVEGLGPRNAGTVFLNVNDPAAAARQDVRATTHVGYWQAGEPDLVRPLEPRRVDARQDDSVQRSIVDLQLKSERRVTAVEYMPGDRRVVRAAVFRLESTGQWMGSWTPWYGHTRLPDGVGVRIPRGSRIVAEIHYRGASQAVVERGELGLHFADRPVTAVSSDLVLEPLARSRANDTRGLVRSTVPVTSDMRVWALQPEIAADLDSLEVTAHRPDGGTEILLYARDVSAQWPTPFILKKPLLLRRGTQVSFIARSKDSSRDPGARMLVARY